jgi:hypothetical protein
MNFKKYLGNYDLFQRPPCVKDLIKVDFKDLRQIYIIYQILFI